MGYWFHKLLSFVAVTDHRYSPNSRTGETKDPGVPRRKDVPWLEGLRIGAENKGRMLGYGEYQWEFQDRIQRRYVGAIFLAIFWWYIPLHRPYCLT